MENEKWTQKEESPLYIIIDIRTKENVGGASKSEIGLKL